MTTIIPGVFIALLGAAVSIHSYMRWFIDSSDTRPGMMALVSGLALLALGIAIAWVDLKRARLAGADADVPVSDSEETQTIEQSREWLSAGITLGAIAVFAILVGPLGLAGAIVAVCVSVAILARFNSIVGFIFFLLCLIGFVYLVFILGLQLPMKVLP